MRAPLARRRRSVRAPLAEGEGVCALPSPKEKECARSPRRRRRSVRAPLAEGEGGCARSPRRGRGSVRWGEGVCALPSPRERECARSLAEGEGVCALPSPRERECARSPRRGRGGSVRAPLAEGEGVCALPSPRERECACSPRRGRGSVRAPLAEGEGVCVLPSPRERECASLPSPPEGERDRVRGRAGRGIRVREWSRLGADSCEPYHPDREPAGAGRGRDPGTRRLAALEAATIPSRLHHVRGSRGPTRVRGPGSAAAPGARWLAPPDADGPSVSAPAAARPLP